MVPDHLHTSYSLCPLDPAADASDDDDDDDKPCASRNLGVIDVKKLDVELSKRKLRQEENAERERGTDADIGVPNSKVLRTKVRELSQTEPVIRNPPILTKLESIGFRSEINLFIKGRG